MSSWAEALPCEGAEALAQGAQRSCGCPIPAVLKARLDTGARITPLRWKGSLPVAAPQKAQPMAQGDPAGGLRPRGAPPPAARHRGGCAGAFLPRPSRGFPPPRLRAPPAAAMFRGRSAWFSQSVSPGPRELWAAGGGECARWQDAEYLFSSDAAHPDTRRIHESLNYLEGRATVFHSSYLSAWANTSVGKKKSVALGHFVLPPACLHEEIRRQIGCFIWEQVDDSLAEQRDRDLMDRSEAVGTGGEEEEDEHVLDLTQSEEETDPTAPEEECPYRALHEYPMNNMVTGNVPCWWGKYRITDWFGLERTLRPSSSNSLPWAEMPHARNIPENKGISLKMVVDEAGTPRVPSTDSSRTAEGVGSSTPFPFPCFPGEGGSYPSTYSPAVPPPRSSLCRLHLRSGHEEVRWGAPRFHSRHLRLCCILD
ncbi:telomere repeats-binding bouquet formation protein 2 isoform 2-T2 [Guaruba guarouba]